MKKRIWALTLLVGLFCLLPAGAMAADTETNVIQTVRALGIMQGDGSGNLNLSNSVTRAEFAKMLVAASSYHDTISEEGTGYSLFQDVKSSHWASEYIKTAVEAGWLVGYTDGTFRPDQGVTLEEACTALLRLLGYESADLAGSFPQAQLSKASALGLRDQVSASQGSKLTRRECMYLFYHLMIADTKDGQVYATTLGYTVTNGEVDYMAIVAENLSGPYVATSSQISLPFTAATVYRDGNVSTLSALNTYDVYYYSEDLQTVWIYTEKVSGTISALSPSAASPTSVTVAGQEYSIGTSDAAYQLSALSGRGTGDVVTLLLGMDGSVVSVVTGYEVNSTYYGVVQSYENIASTDGAAKAQTEVTVACTNGTVQTFTMDGTSAFSVGRLVSVTVSDGQVSVKSLSEKSIKGTIDSSGTKLGNYTFADNVEILDTTSTGDYVTVKPARLAGQTLDDSDVRYYVLAASGNISHLILDDVTGDTWNYGFMIEVDEPDADEMGGQTSYSYIMDGVKTTLTPMNVEYDAKEERGFGVRYDASGNIKTFRNLTAVSLTQLNTWTALAENKTYTVSEEVQVCLYQNGEYYPTNLSSINL